MNRSPFIVPFFQIESIFSKKKILWDAINLVVQKKHLGLRNFNWSNETFITHHQWLQLLNLHLEPLRATDFTLDLAIPQNRSALLASLMSICSWRYSQGCYNLNDDLYKQAISNSVSAVISPNHFINMTEWTACIPLQNVQFNNRKVFNFFAHKTYLELWPNQKLEPNCLVLTFNIEPHPDDTRLLTKDRDFKPLPYVILRADQFNTLENAIIEFGAFPMSFTGPADFVRFIAPYISIFNTVFDPACHIESEYVGEKRPHYSDVETNINFNDLNIPTVKHLAPSNTRNWQVGNNIYAKLKQAQRKNDLAELPEIKWVISNSSLQMMI